MNMIFSVLTVSAPVKGSLCYCWTLLALVLFLQPAVAQLCTFWHNNCVDPLAQTAVSVSFRPLILRDISLYYAYDANPDGKDGSSMTKTSFWLTWNYPRVDKSVVTANRTSEIGLRFGNLTGTPGGTNNGCDSVWGTACSKELKDYLKAAIYDLSVGGEHYSQPLETVLNHLTNSRPSIGSCPPQIFDVNNIPVEGMYDCSLSRTLLCSNVLTILATVFAQERVPEQYVTLRSPGSMFDPFKTWYVNNTTASDQADQVAVAILSRGPSYHSEPPRSPDDVQIELACLQAPEGDLPATIRG